DAELTRLAETGGGEYFRAIDFDSLKKVYEQIDAMERTEVDVERFVRYEEQFAPFVLIGLALLALEQALRWTRLAVLSN
ncbi:MAG: aerotolerance regulator BatA, partial [Kiritimatiellia bacterium]|nr:aerotolerance regulator BatA [Kiritimatiellia bacterium]